MCPASNIRQVGALQGHGGSNAIQHGLVTAIALAWGGACGAISAFSACGALAVAPSLRLHQPQLAGAWLMQPVVYLPFSLLPSSPWRDSPSS